MDKLIAFLGLAAMGLIAVFVIAFFCAFITQLAWSGSMVPLFHLPELTYWQAFSFNVLGGMLCKSSSNSISKSNKD